MLSKDYQDIEEILETGVEKIIDKDRLKESLGSKKKLRIKHGIDPTGPKIHLGRAAQLWKLRQFQDLGHQVVLILGDFTAQIGDPSDKPDGRRGLTEKEINLNLNDYLRQVGKILNISKAEIRYNSEWLGKIGLKDFLTLANNFSVQQLIHRRNFKERWMKKKPISFAEVSYPILQGYDSVAIKADLELGGYDQLFNLKMGRILQRIFNQKSQDIMTLKMLPGLDERKMSTSWGNVVNIEDEATEMYGKLMSMNDKMVPIYYEMCLFTPLGELTDINRSLKEDNPRDIKARLAGKITELYHGKLKSQTAQKEFERVFREKKEPQNIRKYFVPRKEYPLTELIKGLHFAESRSEAKRLIEGGGVKIDGEKITDIKRIIKVKEGMLVQSGKLNFARLTYEQR